VQLKFSAGGVAGEPENIDVQYLPNKDTLGIISTIICRLGVASLDVRDGLDI